VINITKNAPKGAFLVCIIQQIIEMLAPERKCHKTTGLKMFDKKLGQPDFFGSSPKSVVNFYFPKYSSPS